MQDRTIVARRWLIAFPHVSACAAFAGGVYLIRESGDPSLPDTGRHSAMNVGLSGVVLLIAGLAGFGASVVRLFRPPSLELTPAALVVKRTFSDARRILWGDVAEFYVTGSSDGDEQTNLLDGLLARRTSQSNPVVNVRYVNRQGLMALAAGSQSGFGRDEVLPAVDFGMSPDALAKVLNDYRAAALTAKSGIP